MNKIDKQYISAQKALRDVAFFKSSLESVHSGLFDYITHSDFDAGYNNICNAIRKEGEITKDEFENKLAMWVSTLNCIHTRVNTDQRLNTIEKDKGFLPLKIEIVGEDVLLKWNCSENSNLKPGIKVLSINSKSIRYIINHIMSYLPKDGKNGDFRLRKIENEFSFLYSLYCESPEQFDIIYCNDDTEQHSVQLNALDREDIGLYQYLRYSKRNKAQFSPLQLKIEEKNNERYVLLKIKSFNNIVIKKAGMNLNQFLNSAFQKIKSENLQHLVIDLRGNFGGNVNNAKRLLSYLLPKSVQYIDYMKIGLSIKDAQKLELSLMDKLILFFRTKKEKNHYRIIQSDSSKCIKPNKTIFEGKIFYLVDSAVSSAAQLPLVVNRIHPHAVTVGNFFNNIKEANGGKMLTLKLPNSGIKITVPVVKTCFTVYSANGMIDYIVDTDRQNGIDHSKELILSLI